MTRASHELSVKAWTMRQNTFAMLFALKNKKINYKYDVNKINIERVVIKYWYLKI